MAARTLEILHCRGSINGLMSKTVPLVFPSWGLSSGKKACPSPKGLTTLMRRLVVPSRSRLFSIINFPTAPIGFSTLSIENSMLETRLTTSTLSRRSKISMNLQCASCPGVMWIVDHCKALFGEAWSPPAWNAPWLWRAIPQTGHEGLDAGALRLDPESRLPRLPRAGALLARSPEAVTTRQGLCPRRTSVRPHAGATGAPVLAFGTDEVGSPAASERACGSVSDVISSSGTTERVMAEAGTSRRCTRLEPLAGERVVGRSQQPSRGLARQHDQLPCRSRTPQPVDESFFIQRAPRAPFPPARRDSASPGKGTRTIPAPITGNHPGSDPALEPAAGRSALTGLLH